MTDGQADRATNNREFKPILGGSPKKSTQIIQIESLRKK